MLLLTYQLRKYNQLDDDVIIFKQDSQVIYLMEKVVPRINLRGKLTETTIKNVIFIKPYNKLPCLTFVEYRMPLKPKL